MAARGSLAWLGFGLGLALAAGVSGQPRAQVPPPQDAASAPRALLDRYCVACHNDRTRQAGLTLQSIDAEHVGRVPGQVEAWEKVVRKLRARAMPPPGRPRPDAGAYDAAAAALEAALDRAAADNPNPGRPPIHRLNRVEYRNAVRDLLALDIDERALLPPDESGYGFDNIADVLAISPVLLDRYMAAAGKISRLALGDAAIRPAVETYTVPYTLWQEGRMSEDLPFGSRGGLAVRHHFPLDGEYVIRLELQRAYGNHIRGLQEPNDIELRLDRARIGRFTVGGEGVRAPWNAVSRPTLYEQTADEGLEVRLDVSAGTRLVSAAFIDRAAVAEGVLEPRPAVSSLAYSRDRNAAMALDSIEIAGPYGGSTPADTPSRRRVFSCYPAAAAEEAGCAAEIVSTLARRAFRRPVDEADTAPLLALYEEGRREGGFERGIQLVVRGLLIDPEFLFRIERDPDGMPPGDGLSGQRSGAGLAPVVLPVEQPAGRRAARRRGGRAPAAAGRAARADRPPARRPACGCLHRQLLRPVAAAAQHADGGPGPRRVSGLRREPARGAAAGDGALRREPGARRPQRPRPAAGGLHLPERAPRAALRRRERLRQPFPAGERRRPAARRAAGPGQRADRHLVSEPDLADQARPVGAGEPARRAAARRRRRRCRGCPTPTIPGRTAASRCASGWRSTASAPCARAVTC